MRLESFICPLDVTFTVSFAVIVIEEPVIEPAIPALYSGRLVHSPAETTRVPVMEDPFCVQFKRVTQVPVP